MADHQQPSAMGGPDRLRSLRLRFGECAVGGGRKRRPGVGASLRRVRILGAGHYRPGCWRGLYGRLPFHSLASRFSAWSDATTTEELEWTCALVLMLFVINLPLRSAAIAL